jgi:phage-related protein
MVRNRNLPRPLVWRGASKSDFLAFPPVVQREMVKESHESNAYRAVYTVRYADAVYVLHAFQKKSKKGAATPKTEIDAIEKRLKDLINEKERQR